MQHDRISPKIPLNGAPLVLNHESQCCSFLIAGSLLFGCYVPVCTPDIIRYVRTTPAALSISSSRASRASRASGLPGAQPHFLAIEVRSASRAQSLLPFPSARLDCCRFCSWLLAGACHSPDRPTRSGSVRALLGYVRSMEREPSLQRVHAAHRLLFVLLAGQCATF